MEVHTKVLLINSTLANLKSESNFEWFFLPAQRFAGLGYLNHGTFHNAANMRMLFHCHAFLSGYTECVIYIVVLYL